VRRSSRIIDFEILRINSWTTIAECAAEDSAQIQILELVVFFRRERLGVGRLGGAFGVQHLAG